MDNLLEIKDLKIVFDTGTEKVTALNGISLYVAPGETLGIVGESGSGKSVAMLSAMRLLPDNGRVEEGRIIFNGKPVTDMTDKQMQQIRGKDIGMIFQDPTTSLNPVFTIGNQLMEGILEHNHISKRIARENVVEMLELVGIPGPKRCMKQYPHELSGGMRQRVMIATALLCKPKLLIADEPTSALDVTIQAQIMELLKLLKNRINMAIILITHDFGLAADICDRVVVMHNGSIVEQRAVADIFYNARHPYTIGLLNTALHAGMKETEQATYCQETR